MTARYTPARINQAIAANQAIASGLPVQVTLNVKGGLFTKDIPAVVQDALLSEVIDKAQERINRPYHGKRLGRARNIITPTRLSGFSGEGSDFQSVTVGARDTSTLLWPRTSGKTWLRKNVGIVRAMAPRVLNAAARRIASEMAEA